MRIEQLYYFLEAAKAGSFTKAAKNLYLQQPSLRDGIINLENELGRPLFERTRRGVKLTDYGEKCLPHIQQMVDTYEMLTDNPLIENSDHKILHIEANSVYAMGSNIAVSDELYCRSAKGRECRISINDNKTEVINKVIKQDIDIGLIIYFQEELAQNEILMKQLDRAYRLVELRKHEILVYMRQDHPLARKKQITVKDAADYLLIFAMVSNPLIKELFNVELGKGNFNYTHVTDMKLVSKYCLRENSLFFVPAGVNNILDDGLIYRVFDKRYVQHYAAVVQAKALSDDVTKYIEIIKTLIQTGTITG